MPGAFLVARIRGQGIHAAAVFQAIGPGLFHWPGMGPGLLSLCERFQGLPWCLLPAGYGGVLAPGAAAVLVAIAAAALSMHNGGPGPCGSWIIDSPTAGDRLTERNIAAAYSIIVRCFAL